MKKIFLLLAIMAFAIISCSKDRDGDPDPSKPNKELEKLIAADRAALVAIYENNGGESWESAKEWLSESPLNEWEGVETNSDGRVVELMLYDNKLEGDFDASGLTALVDLDVAHSKITSLDVSKNKTLETLWCSATQITELDVTKNTNLKQLHITNSGITEIDLSKNTKLTNLSASYVGLTELDLSHNIELEELKISAINIEMLDLSKNPKIKNLKTLDENDIKENQVNHIKEIICDASSLIIAETIGTWGDKDEELYQSPYHIDGYQYPKFTYVNYDQKEIDKVIAADKAALLAMIENPNFQKDPAFEFNWDASLPLSEWRGIETSLMGYASVLDLSYSKISGEVALDGLSHIEYIIISNNNISKLSITNMPKLTNLNFYKNGVESLNVSNLPELKEIHGAENKLESATIVNFPKLESIAINKNSLTSITLENLPALESLACGTNLLTDIPQAYLPNLKELGYSTNKLTSVTLTGDKMPKLLYLELGINELSELNLSGLKDLSFIGCRCNFLTSCTLKDLPSLSEIDFALNEDLATIDLSKISSLKILYCSSTKVESLDLSKCKDIEEIYCESYSENNYIKTILLAKGSEAYKSIQGAWGEKDATKYPEPNHVDGYQFPKITFK